MDPWPLNVLLLGRGVARKGGPGIGRADLLIVNKMDLAEYGDVDVDQMVADGKAARDDGEVLPLSRKQPETIEQLCNWVLRLHAAHISGDHEPTDPGPMAPHFHATEDGGYVHSHDNT